MHRSVIPCQRRNLSLNILTRCELNIFSEYVRQMLIQAIESLYYSESLKIGNAILPQAKVRSYLNLLDCDTHISMIETMKSNEGRTIYPLLSSRKNKKSNGYLFSRSGKLNEKIIEAIDINRNQPFTNKNNIFQSKVHIKSLLI